MLVLYVTSLLHLVIMILFILSLAKISTVNNDSKQDNTTTKPIIIRPKVDSLRKKNEFDEEESIVTKENSMTSQPSSGRYRTQGRSTTQPARRLSSQ